MVLVEVEDSDHVERQVGHHHHHHRGVEVHQPLQTLLLHGGDVVRITLMYAMAVIAPQ